MRHLSVIIFIWNCCVFLANAQHFSFEVTTSGFETSDKIYLKKYYGREEVVMDSISGSGNRTFHVNTSLPVRGLYFISYSKNSYAEIICSPNEKMAVLVDKQKLAEGQVTIENSPENAAYQEFLQAYLEYDQSFYSFMSLKYDDFDPQLVTKLKKRSDVMVIVQEASNNSFDEIAKKYPGTYSTEVLVPLVSIPPLSHNKEYLKMYDNYPAFLFRHYWDKVDFTNSEMLNHFMLNEMLKNYYRSFVPKHPDSMKVAIDMVLEKAGVNEAIYQHIHSFLLRNFLNSNAEDLTLYMMNKGDGETCGLNLTPEELKKFETLKSLAVGAKVPETSLPDVEMNKIALSQVYRKNKATLVVFWTAHCSKCQSEIPEIKKVYEAHRNKGFEVYAINLDENKFSWRDALQERELNWINVTDEVPLKDSNVLVDFNVSRTPQTFLLDGNGIIIAKDLNTSALNKKLEEILN